MGAGEPVARVSYKGSGPVSRVGHWTVLVKSVHDSLRKRPYRVTKERKDDTRVLQGLMSLGTQWSKSYIVTPRSVFLVSTGVLGDCQG